MNIFEKNQAFINCCKSLKRYQRIVFSDEGNLNHVKDIDIEHQISKARGKPYGLWYSFGDSWIKWLTDNYKDLHSDERDWTAKRMSRYTHIYQLNLRRKFIYQIRTARDFDRFTKKYGNKLKDKIRWKEVHIDGWLGIEVSYISCRDKSTSWYDGWDCSSGCIWDNAAVKNVTLLKKWNLVFQAA